jgi:type VI secretion system secreted protein VgrG
MAAYTQAGRPFTVNTPLGPDALLLAGLRGTEAVSEPFRFDLDLLAPANTAVPFEKLLGQPATVAVQLPGGNRHLNGIVTEFRQGPRVQAADGRTAMIRYRAVLVPKFALLAHTVRSRIFQQIAVPDILKQVLTGFNVTYKIQGSYKPRDYCVQYRESDFAFASRLMEEEGIFYFFQHDADSHTLVVADTPLIHPEVPGATTVPFDDAAGGTRAEDRVTAWEKRQRLGSGKFVLKDYDFEMPDSALLATATVPASAAAGTVTHPLTPGGSDAWEAYDFPGRFAQRFDGVGPGGADQSANLQDVFPDGQRTVGLRGQEGGAGLLTVRGEGSARQFAAGYQFKLSGHFNGDGPYVLTRVEHRVDLTGQYLAGQGEATILYTNRFEAIPAALPYRPSRRTPRPRAEGVQAAKVVGPTGEDIFCDKYGRIKVQFPWDLAGRNNADSSCWLRVAQPWAGGGWGSVVLPRVGQEVVVAFEHGDPDTPIVVGSVYNAANMPPYALPKYRAHSGMRTRTRQSTSADDFSGLTFEDTKDNEHVHMHSERHMTLSAEGNYVKNVGSSHHERIAGPSTRIIGGLPGVNYSLGVGANDTISAGGSTGGSGSGSGPVVGGVPAPAAGAPVPRPGSGSGSGNDPPTADQISQQVAQDTEGPYYQNPAAVWGGPASHIDAVLGFHTSNTIGLYSTLKFGTNLSTTINPFMLDDMFGVTIPYATPLLSLLGAGRAGMGASSVVMGTNTAIHYGRAISFQTGPKFIDDAAHLNVSYGAAITGGILYNLAVIGEMFLPLIPTPTNSTWTAVEMSAEGAAQQVVALTSLSAWAYAITACSQANFHWRAGHQAETSTLVVPKTDQPTKSAIRVNEEDDTSLLSGPGEDFADVVNQHDSPYTLSAPLLTLLSAPLPTDDGEVNGILIQATGLEGIDGVVTVYGTGSSYLLGGDMASVSCVTEGEAVGIVTIDCGGPEGSIILQSGEEQEPNSMLLGPEGVILQSAEEITVMVEENLINVAETGITLSVGQSGIEIGEEGITLFCGPNVIEISDEGIVVNGITLELTADAEASLAAPMIEIGP